MWNRSLHVVWIKIHLSGNTHFYMNLPISMYVFEELLDCFMDLLAVACFFVPTTAQAPRYSVSIHSVREIMLSIIRLLDQLSFEEPYELVEVEVENVQVSIKIR